MNQLKQLYKESKFNIILFIPCISLTSVQLLSHIWHFVTPWTAADQASCPLLTLKFTQTHPLSQWCHPTISFSVVPFSSHLQYFQASGSFQMSQFFTSGSQSTGVSASTSVLPMNTGLISFRIDRFDLLAVQGTLKSLLQHHSSKHHFFSAQLSLWSNSHPHITIGKTIALTRQTFVSKVISAS